MSNETAPKNIDPAAALSASGTAFAGQLPPADLARVLDVKVEVTVELGRRRMSIADVLHLSPNAVLEFFKKSDDPLDVRVNGRLVARGEAVVMGDRYGVRISEVIHPNRSQGTVEVQDVTS
jgi:flagellar motor switch protein FliN/FliY